MRPTYCSGGTILTGVNSNVSTRSISSSSIGLKSKDYNGHLQHRIGAKRSPPAPMLRSSSEGVKPLSYPEETTKRPSSPFIVYRSAKYIKPHARFLRKVRGYSRYYVVAPIRRLANQCKLAFYQLCGLLLLLVASPLLILLLLGLFVVRRLRMCLIQKLYPDLCPVDDQYNSCKSYKTSESLDVGIVNSLVWTRGKVDVDIIRKRFQVLFTENQEIQQQLSLRLVSKLGVSLWETSENFVLEDHIVEAPKMFHNCPIVDEPLKELYRTGSNKSILQKYISYCVSLPMERTTPPWKIHVVSYVSRDNGIRERTCLVIRMHVTLINNQCVRRALRELFVNYESMYTSSSEAIPEQPSTMSNIMSLTDKNDTVNDENMNTKESVWGIGRNGVQMTCLGERIKKISFHYRKNLGTWFSLRLKQLEFHSKPFVMAVILADLKIAAKRCLVSLEDFLHETWIRICSCIRCVLEIIQALAAIPVIILGSLIRGRNFKKLGLQRNVNMRRLISWSDLIHDDLIDEICKKTETTSFGNVVIMACSYALRDYYQQNNIAVPGTIGFTVAESNNDLRSGMSLKAVRAPCEKSRYSLETSGELKSMRQTLDTYPGWQLLGLCYTLKYLHCFMPTYFAQKVHSRIVSCFPFIFTHLDMNTMTSFANCHEHIRQIYGEIVEEFCFWQLPPLSDDGVSITLVRYSGKTRLFVMSPYQSMDTILTQRCNQYLIKIAEDVGVERSRIPYSRRSSPSSTSCSTPQIPAYFFNNFEKRSL